MNGLTLLGLIGMAWVAVSVLLGVGIGRCCYDDDTAVDEFADLADWEAELSWSSRETGMRQHPAGGGR